MNGVEKGWAAEVDVAAGGFAGEDRCTAVDNLRRFVLRLKPRRQRWHIMILVQEGYVLYH